MSYSKMRQVCLAFLILIVSLTACQLAGKPAEEESTRRPSEVGAVSAQTSPSGAVHVSIAYYRGYEEAVTLSCTYPGEDGQPRQYTYVDNQPGTVTDNIRRDSLDFVVDKPGQYQVTCQIENSTRSAEFKIEESAAGETPKTAPKSAPSQTDPVTKTESGGSQPVAFGPFTSGRMWLEFARATSRGPNYHLLQGCLPGLKLADTAVSHYGDTNLKVASDGTLSGECTANLTTADGTLQTTSQLTQGQWTADGQVTFRLETSVVLNVKDGAGSANLVWIGTGQFISPTTASGTATWSATCQGVDCSGASDNGDIPWVIDFYP